MAPIPRASCRGVRIYRAARPPNAAQKPERAARIRRFEFLRSQSRPEAPSGRTADDQGFSASPMFAASRDQDRLRGLMENGEANRFRPLALWPICSVLCPTSCIATDPGFPREPGALHRQFGSPSAARSHNEVFGTDLDRALSAFSRQLLSMNFVSQVCSTKLV